MSVLSDDVRSRFWRRVDKSGGVPSHVPEIGECWRWTGKLNDAGYGRLSVHRGVRGGIWRAHRVSWTLHFGAIPDGLWVLHRCDNPACVRPHHLFTGTHLDNVRDCIGKGRFHDGHGYLIRGERNPGAKVTERQAADIRARYDAERTNENARLIAAQYGLSRSQVQRIAYGGAWSESRISGEQSE
jgi:hypothetical protein